LFIFAEIFSSHVPALIPVLKDFIVLFFKLIDQNSSELIARNHCIEERQFDGVAV
jgi:hypothetical protein